MAVLGVVVVPVPPWGSEFGGFENGLQGERKTGEGKCNLVPQWG